MKELETETLSAKGIDLLSDIFLEDVNGAVFYLETNSNVLTSKFHFIRNNFSEYNLEEINTFDDLLNLFNRRSEICQAEGADYYLDLVASIIRDKNSKSSFNIPVLKGDRALTLNLRKFCYKEKGICVCIIDVLEGDKENYEQLIANSYKDPLTGLFNRNAFELHSKMATNGIHYVGFMDIDLFKRVNDTYSHQRGNELLHDIGGVMIYGVSNDNVIFYRLSGDEFLFFSNDYSKEQMEIIIEKLRESLKRLKIDDFIPTFSIGYVEMDLDNAYFDKSEVVNLADIAMYKSKVCGGNRVTYFTKEDILNLTKNSSIVATLNQMRKMCSRKPDADKNDKNN